MIEPGREGVDREARCGGGRLPVLPADRVGDLYRRNPLVARRADIVPRAHHGRSEEHTSELQSLMRISYAVFCLKKTEELTTYIHSPIRNTDPDLVFHINTQQDDYRCRAGTHTPR